uniref:Pentatricopeptide repeat-containing protein n=1 Tax=Kalanchoe fedtschenkoi TaxID=63787 RepID=A0A7N0TTY9_KALFE
MLSPTRGGFGDGHVFRFRRPVSIRRLGDCSTSFESRPLLSGCLERTVTGANLSFGSLSSFSLEPPDLQRFYRLEQSRVNASNYEKIIGLLSDEGLVTEASALFAELKSLDLTPSSSSYSSIICGLAKKGGFAKALSFLDEMIEVNLIPDSQTFHALIQAYGRYNMYDEIGDCLKRMEVVGCLPDHLTCNLLIQEFSRGGLIKRMEKLYHTALTKRVHLQPSTSVAMLDAYAKFGPIDRMEKMLKRVVNSNSQIKDDSVRKVATVYIDNYMFSRLDDLGLALSSISGSPDLVWCLRLLSHACLLSRKGMDSVIGAMEVAGVSWTITTANIILLTYLKMQDFTHLRAVLHDLVTNQIKPDMVTVGILFDAIGNGFDGTHTLQLWQRMGFLSEALELSTDPLVLAAFGKGKFLKCCEDIYSRFDPEDREGRNWSYKELIDLVPRICG